MECRQRLDAPPTQAGNFRAPLLDGHDRALRQPRLKLIQGYANNREGVVRFTQESRDAQAMQLLLIVESIVAAGFPTGPQQPLLFPEAQRRDPNADKMGRRPYAQAPGRVSRRLRA